METNYKKALLIGINYRNSQYELHGCINDTIHIKEMLISQYKFLSQNILVLTDDTKDKPTRSNILESWKWLLSKSPAQTFNKSSYTNFNSNDKATLFFHYSGHGAQIKDINGEEIDGMDETIYPIDFLSAGAIIDDTIRDNLISQVTSNIKLFCLMDACHSESSMDLVWNVKIGSTGNTNLVKLNYPSTLGEVCMLSGCKDDQVSADITINGTGRGALTYAFIEVLKQAKYNITYQDLVSKVQKYIIDNHISNQVPCLSFGKLPDISHKFLL